MAKAKGQAKEGLAILANMRRKGWKTPQNGRKAIIPQTTAFCKS
jgi:hypothetical protein